MRRLFHIIIFVSSLGYSTSGQVSLTPIRSSQEDSQMNFLLHNGIVYGTWSSTSLSHGKLIVPTPQTEVLRYCQINALNTPLITAIYKSPQEPHAFIVRIYNQDLRLIQDFPLKRGLDRGLPLIRPFSSAWVLCLFPDDQSYLWVSPSKTFIKGSVFGWSSFDLEKKILTATTADETLYSLHMRSESVTATQNVILMRWTPGHSPDSVLVLPLTMPYDFLIRSEYGLITGTWFTDPESKPEFLQYVVELSNGKILWEYSLNELPRESYLYSGKILRIYNSRVTISSVGKPNGYNQLDFPPDRFVHGSGVNRDTLWILTSHTPQVDKHGVTYSGFQLWTLPLKSMDVSSYTLDIPESHHISVTFAPGRHLVLVENKHQLLEFKLPARP